MQTKQKFKRIVFLFFVSFILLLLISNVTSFVIEKINFYNNYGSLNGNPNDFIFPIPEDFITPGYYSKVFLYNVLKWLLLLTEDVGSIFIGTFQDAILILFDGSIFYSALGINYVVYLEIISGIFTFLLLFFLATKFFKKGVTSKNDSKKVTISIFNSVTLLIMIILLFQILFLGSRYLIQQVFKIGGIIDIFGQLEKITIGQISENIDGNVSSLMKVMAIIVDTKVYDVLEEKMINIKLFIPIDFRALTIAYIVSFLFSVWFILFMLIKFSFTVFQRIINILFFGIIGFPFVAASVAEDGGNRLNSWNSMMIHETFSPFLSLFIYLLLIVSMAGIFGIIDKFKISPIFSSSSEAITLSLKIISLNGSFLILTKFSSGWSDNITKTNTENNIQEFVNITSSNQKNVNYDFNENYSFSTDNFITKNTTNVTKNITRGKEKINQPSIDINETLSKIERREF